MTENAALVELVEQSGDLPAMPSIVSEVLQKTDDPSVEMADVSKIIENDPALAAKILQVSNSSYYGMKQYVDTLTLALVILGVREVRNIVLGVSVFETLKSDKGDAKLAQDIWNNSLKIAGMAKKITKQLALGLQGQEFIAGLLSDTGKMILLRMDGVAYAKILKACRDEPRSLIHQEMEQFAFHHGDAATALARKWDLPKSLCDALWNQYSGEDRSIASAADPTLAYVVRISRAAMADDFSEPEGQASVNDEEAWVQLSGAKNPVAGDQRYSVLKGFLEELAQAPLNPSVAAMPKKEDIQIVRADNFQQVDEDLTEAMKCLDETNTRIEELLQSPDGTIPESSATFDDEEEDGGDDAPTEDAAESEPETDAS